MHKITSVAHKGKAHVSRKQSSSMTHRTGVGTLPSGAHAPASYVAERRAMDRVASGVLRSWRRK